MKSSTITKLRSAELTGAALAWAVAQVAGVPYSVNHGIEGSTSLPMLSTVVFEPSKSWEQAGPLVEKNMVSHNAYGVPKYPASHQEMLAKQNQPKG